MEINMDLKSFFKSLITDNYIEKNSDILNMFLKNLENLHLVTCHGMRGCDECFLLKACSDVLIDVYYTTIEDQRILIRECINERMDEYRQSKRTSTK